jgi:uncharacterized protein YaeQ
MKKEVMMLRLLAEIRAGHEEIMVARGTNREEMREEMKAWRKR